MSENSANTGIYIHIPFCIKKCPYCNFYSISDISLKRRFITALLKEIELRSNPYLIVDTIYFGGGTPSLMTCEEIEEIIMAVGNNFQLTDSQNRNCNSNLQITLEVNPGSIKNGYLKEIRDIGVTRLSVGVQSFNDKKLKFLQRIHSANDAHKTILNAQDAQFEDIGIDLIYGLPEETKNIWLGDINQALEYKPEHLSCYMLSYERDTYMFASYERGDIIPLDDEKVAALFMLTSQHLISKGFSHYEISNFAAALKYQSKHNKKYWEMSPYLGFGPSAHSYRCCSSLQYKRLWNVKSVSNYISMLNKGNLPVDEIEILTHEQRVIELIMVSLRTEKGLNIKSFEKLHISKQNSEFEKLYSSKKRYNKRYEKEFYKSSFQFKIIFKNVLDQLEKREWGYIEQESLKLTTDGWLFLDTIIRWFVDTLQINDKK